MNRRGFILRMSGVIIALSLLFVGTAEWKARQKQRAFDPVAVALLERNHRRMASLRGVSGTLVKTDGISVHADRTITNIRLLKPNYQRIMQTFRIQEWQSSGRWRALPDEYIAFHSDGVTYQVYNPDNATGVSTSPSAPISTTPVKPRGENLEVVDPCLYGFFDAPLGPKGRPGRQSPRETHFVLVDYGRARNSSVEFVRYDGRASVHGIPCEIVTYKRPRDSYNPTLLEWIKWSTIDRHRPTGIVDQYTLYIDAGGLIRRTVLQADEVTKLGGEISEWRDVQVDPPWLMPADFRLNRLKR